MNYNIILFLALIFGFLTLIPLLAQSFLRAQGLGSAESRIVLLYAGLGLSRIRECSEKESPKYKTKPIQSQFKAKQSQFFGGFWRKNFNFSLKIDDTKLNLLCKTKPIYKTTQWSMRYHLIEKIQHKANLFFETSIM